MGPAGNPQTRQWDCLRQEPRLQVRAQQVQGTADPGAPAGRGGARLCPGHSGLCQGGQALSLHPGGRRGQEGQKRKTGPPRPPGSAPNAAGLPPTTPSTRGTRVAPIRALDCVRGEGGVADSAASAALPGAPAQPQERAQPPEPTPARPAPRRPAPTSEGQRRPQAHVHGPCQRLPGAVDDAAVAQADLEELHPPHAARGPDRTAARCCPRPPAGRLCSEHRTGPTRPRPRPVSPSSNRDTPQARPRPRLPVPLCDHAHVPAPIVGPRPRPRLTLASPSPVSATPQATPSPGPAPKSVAPLVRWVFSGPCPLVSSGPHPRPVSPRPRLRPAGWRSGRVRGPGAGALPLPRERGRLTSRGGGAVARAGAGDRRRRCRVGARWLGRVPLRAPRVTPRKDVRRAGRRVCVRGEHAAVLGLRVGSLERPAGGTGPEPVGAGLRLCGAGCA